MHASTFVHHVVFLFLAAIHLNPSQFFWSLTVQMLVDTRGHNDSIAGGGIWVRDSGEGFAAESPHRVDVSELTWVDSTEPTGGFGQNLFDQT